MTDPAFTLLTRSLVNDAGNTLLALDENTPLSELPRLAQFPLLSIVTNRYDIWQSARQIGLNCEFSDFDFSSYPGKSFAQIGFRVAKERPVTHHLINNAVRLLTPGGKLLLTGAKNEGIKSYGKRAAVLFQVNPDIAKRGNVYLACITQSGDAIGDLLDNNSYSELRPEVTLDSSVLYSKPGVFGWDKVDQGSRLLADNLAEFIQQFETPPKDILDLGCGYGYLSVMAHGLVKASFIATDNNAAAVASCRKNFVALGISGKVIADHCANNIAKRFDAVLCHPPFHRGFDTEQKLTEQFVAAAYSRLKPNGKALFVANQFVPLEKQGEKCFSVIKRVAENSSYKVVLFQR